MAPSGRHPEPAVLPPPICAENAGMCWHAVRQGHGMLHGGAPAAACAGSVALPGAAAHKQCRCAAGHCCAHAAAPAGTLATRL